MYKSYIPYLQHILDECLYVCSVIKEDKDNPRTAALLPYPSLWLFTRPQGFTL